MVTITGIAEQTNLLALNAAIEAARAGEQGTQQTSASAQEIAASALTLSGTAGQLNALVRRFKVAA